jgi:hypothetical protein
MAIEVRMANKAGGHPGINKPRPRDPFEVLALGRVPEPCG